MSRLRVVLRRWRGIMSLDRSEYAQSRTHPLDTTDALVAADGGDRGRGEGGVGTGGLPPVGWVEDYDDGRPRK